jgi:predicted cupin superfamily sugar epimerase
VKTAAAVVAELGLAPHPEGGFFREVFRSEAVVAGPGGAPRAASTAILFLLPGGDFSAWHRVASDEVWHHYAGGPLELHTLDDAGHRQVRLGAVSEGHTPVAVVPAGRWQAARPAGAAWVLCGCTVAPGFDFADFELPDRASLAARFPGNAAIIESLTR